VEKLGILLNENPRGLLVFRDEILGWLRTLEREGHQNDRAFFCEAWNGNGSYVYDRVGRGTLYVEHVCVSMLGGIQPRPLAAFLQTAVTRDRKDDDGLIQRFQLAVYPDIPRTWVNIDRAPDREAAARAAEIIRRLDDVRPEELGADVPFEGAVPVLHFDADAQAAFDAWRAGLEHRLRDDDLAPIMKAHLGKYRSLVPSLALLVHLVDCVDRGTGGRVPLAAVTQAVAWAELLEAHAARIYASVTAGPEQAAEVLAGQLERGKLVSPFRLRDVVRKQWTGLTEPEIVAAALGLLEDAGWVRRVKAPTTDRGGRPTSLYYTNPAVSPA
jgi:putative DNA primase/helicase